MDVVVIGNGFDRACGLQSGFDEFMTERFTPQLSENLNFLGNYYFRSIPNGVNPYRLLEFEGLQSNSKGTIDLTDLGSDTPLLLTSELTFWDLLFFFQKDNFNFSNEILWCDVEAQIARFLEEPENGNSISYKYLSDNSNLSGEQFTRGIRLVTLCSALFASLNPEKYDYPSITVFNFLASELEEFENSFRAYLESQVKSAGASYHDRSKYLFNQIVGYDEESVPSDYYLLNFNYTNPSIGDYELSVIEDNEIEKEVDSTIIRWAANNVHGTLAGGESIFGVDSSLFNPTDAQYIFTKTYRQLTSSYSDLQTVDSLPPADEIDAIKFFGHSLSAADYSYFEALFDYCDIYRSKTKIIFYTKPYEGKTPQDMKLSIVESVKNLMGEYAESLTNTEHRKNLLHKMMLERRLFIRILT